MTQYRVAFFTDSFHEVNGVALTSREYINFARRRSIPVLSVHAGPENRVTQDGSVVTFEVKRSPVRWNLEHDLAVDFLGMRHRRRLWQALREFKPELVHLTGPGDVGTLGFWAAAAFQIPRAASWHTNLHEYASRRLSRVLTGVPERLKSWTESKTETLALDACIGFYRHARVLFAPNPELVEILARRTRRPTFLMSRGIDTGLFSPQRRQRTDDAFVIGYVGRLSSEKNVEMLPKLEHRLRNAGMTNYRFLVVGEGSERAWLRAALAQADLPGILRGEELARAYASMDAFVFPSFTDTFGNVVLEAMASGVPPVVSSGGGPKFLFEHGVAGYIAKDEDEFATAILHLMRDANQRTAMRHAARGAAEQHSWDAVFEHVHESYQRCLARKQSLGSPLFPTSSSGVSNSKAAFAAAP